MRYLLLLLCLISSHVYASDITSDRPGVGSDPELVPQYSIQPEIGTDTQEIRLGLTSYLEGSYQHSTGDYTLSGKLKILDTPQFKTSFKLSYDDQLKTVMEIPSNFTINKWFNLGTDIQWSKSSKTYVSEFNIQTDNNLTITPIVYYQDKVRLSFTMAYIPPHNRSLQFDIGYDQSKISIGISKNINFSKLFKKR